MRYTCYFNQNRMNFTPFSLGKKKGIINIYEKKVVSDALTNN